MNRLLVFIPSPRDIPEFNDAVSKIKYDKLWIKYYPQEEAYNRARDWFLDHKQFSHLCILPDDLLMTQEDFDILFKDAQQYDVISGWCRNTIKQTSWYVGPPETEETAASNVSFILPPDPPMLGDYNGYQFITLNDIGIMTDNVDIVKIKFAGFPPTVISRKVVEQIPFRTSAGCCSDSCFCLDIAEKGIDHYCDLRVRTTHMNASEPTNLLVDKKPRNILFEPSS